MNEDRPANFDASVLFAKALEDDQEDERWRKAICELCVLATQEVLETALAWSIESDSRHRYVAALVLGQLSNSSRDANKLYRDERFQTLRRMALNEQHEVSLAAAIIGLGHFAR